MLASKQISAYNDPSKAFVGIRFVLFGFDSVREDEVRAKLLEGGAVDTVNYGPDCNHVIVDNLLYDDPICAAARRDGKILVIGKWVDHCFDGGCLLILLLVLVPACIVMYWPVRDPSGIPAAKSLVMCLTGYLRQDRDDVMNMVALMGATFTKPLLATKVTHLICYKFEGEKYELAKKMKTIKLVNHHWLEDSGFELMMEAQAKDSEEETEDMASVDLKKKSIFSPHSALVENRNFQSPEQQGGSRTSGYVTACESFANVGNTSKTNSTPRKVNTGKTQSIPRKEADFENASLSRDTHCEDIDTSNTSCARSPAKMFYGVPSNVRNGTTNSENIEHVIASASGSARKSVNDGLSKLSTKSTKASLPLRSERIESISGSPLSTASKTGLCGGFDISMERDLDETDSHGIRSTLKGSFLLPNEGKTVGSHRTNNPTVPRGSPRSPVLSHSPKTLIRSGLATKPTEMPVSRSSVDGSCRIPCDMSPLKGALSHLDEEQTGGLPRTKKMTISRRGSKSRRLSRSPTTRSGCLREEVGGAFVRPSENIEDGTESTEIQTLLKGALLYHDEEQPSSLSGTKKMNVPRSGSKSTKRTRSSKILMGSGLDAKPMEMLVSGSSVHGTHQVGADVSPTNVTSCMREEVGGVLNMLSERDGDTTESGLIKTPLEGVSVHPNKEQTSSLPVGTVLDTKATEILVSGTPIHGSRQSAVDISPPTYSRGRPKKRRLPDSDVKDLSASRNKSCTREEDIHQSDPPDVRPPFPGSSSTVEKLDDHTDLNSSKVDNSGTKSKSPKKKMLARKSLGSKPTSCKERTSKYKGLLSAVLQSKSADVPVGDETEAPECKGPNEFDMGSKNSAEVEEHHTSKQSSKRTTQKKEAKSRVKKSTEAKKLAELPESTSRGDVAENKITEGKKRPFAISKMNKLKGPTEEAKQDKKKTVSKKGEMVVSAGKTSKRPSKKLKGSHDVEKENEPVMQPIVSCDTGAASDSTHKSKKPLKDGSKVDKVNTKDLPTKAEPAWFILSGHRLQRKEFQQVIKRLKGKVCRDSHNWSYQATHFIVPDLIRRTEKFFAAAASGSWILKTDYLTASTEAGRLLPEEPYEWQKKCLTEDGSINLEAPRKWRLLRERTVHGAFYGMRIVIYGECIAPPLDTLKHVIKAGDGTILATSPPYTRFLNSRVDFAIVSGGMPRVDMWVQEFLRHEIPCILADYLVCKRGYSLDKHVQYQTHAWAKRSLENLVNRVEAVEDHPKTPEEHRVDDTVCQGCGSRDRGDEMLICGDESGTHGCGVGTHMDCQRKTGSAMTAAIKLAAGVPRNEPRNRRSDMPSDLEILARLNVWHKACEVAKDS
ncbi:hypothetical protein SASPL_119960 [Salvia splendens]|uniref:BRCT domain-containing protein n=1 Tax=Salvia splendens TaxID=180675 RepID=A0A8X8ZTJ8_SALSN|nr:hypothetical protein SASPL_119960 [Salvia splendens]